MDPSLRRDDSLWVVWAAVGVSSEHSNLQAQNNQRGMGTKVRPEMLEMSM